MDEIVVYELSVLTKLTESNITKKASFRNNIIPLLEASGWHLFSKMHALVGLQEYLF